MQIPLVILLLRFVKTLCLLLNNRNKRHTKLLCLTLCDLRRCKNEMASNRRRIRRTRKRRKRRRNIGGTVTMVVLPLLDTVIATVRIRERGTHI